MSEINAMKNIEPKEALYRALGMVQALAMVNTNDNLAEALGDIAYYILWVLNNSTMYKAPEVPHD